MNCQILISEAMTVTFVVIASGAIGWMISIVWNNSKDNSVLKDSVVRISLVLERLENKQEKIDEEVATIKTDFAQLRGEHYTLTRDGTMIEHHGFKKKAQ